MANENNVISRHMEDVEAVKIEPAEAPVSVAQADQSVNYSDDSIEHAISEIVHHNVKFSANNSNPKSTECTTTEVSVISYGDVELTPTTSEAEIEVSKKIALKQLESISKKSPTNETSAANGEQKSNTNIVVKDELEKKLIGAGVGVDDKPIKRILNKNAPCANKNIDKDDLIAILQGTDSIKKEEVIIEGEGQFEVFEVIDNDKDSSSEKDEKEEKNEEKTGSVNLIVEIPKPVVIPRNRRRKQDISKQLVTDLVTTLASEWSDADEENSEIKLFDSTTCGTPTGDDGSKPALIETIQPEQLTSTATPYKRTRIIKRKIIWDPDAPETQFSYASLIKPPSNSSALKKENANKRGRTTPLILKRERSLEAKPVPSSATIDNNKTAKRKSDAIPNILTGTKKKKSEVDKLLGDEGAINMLNSLDVDRNKSEKDQKTINKRDRTISPQSKPTTTTPLKKRGAKPRASSGWDYVYNQRNDDSMIIRRRSNSSYSSNSPRRLSIDVAPVVQTDNKSQLPLTSVSASASTPTQSKEEGFEFAKPENKTNKRPGKIDSVTSSALAADIRKGATRKSTRTIPQPEVCSRLQEDPKETKELLVVKKLGSVTQLILHSNPNKVNYAFTPQLMDEICSNLEVSLKDNDCKVVVLTTAGQHFCQGVDLKSLTVGTSEKRTAYALELARSVRNFLYTLTTFTKPLLAGVVGTNSGLGVTMLPLFDVVFGSDKCYFDTAYAELGHMPEGYSILCLAKNVRHNFKTRMLWLTEKITATESVLSGLITKLYGTNKVCEETLNVAKKIASLSSATYQTMKSQRLKYEWDSMAAWLNEEENILGAQWASSECQERIKKCL